MINKNTIRFGIIILLIIAYLFYPSPFIIMALAVITTLLLIDLLGAWRKQSKKKYKEMDAAKGQRNKQKPKSKTKPNKKKK